jgi:hypothetical protein
MSENMSDPERPGKDIDAAVTAGLPRGMEIAKKFGLGFLLPQGV